MHPGALTRLGRIRHVLFDFDGTLSVLRQGWEEVMVPVMVEAICGVARLPDKIIEQEVRQYIDRSSGILTIHQMEWLVDAVERYGLAGEPRTAAAYKAAYLERLMVTVRQRRAHLESGQADPGGYMIAGGLEFLSGLFARGARLYLASGTDHQDVVHEAKALGLLPYFSGGVYGALDGSEENAKDRVIQRILKEHELAGDELLIIGDGPVEVCEGRQRGALTLGAATDEIACAGWNPRKVERLVNAGADLLVADFNQHQALLDLLFEPASFELPD